MTDLYSARSSHSRSLFSPPPSNPGSMYSGMPSEPYHRPSISDPFMNTTTRGRQQGDNLRRAAGDYGAARAYAIRESQVEADNRATSARILGNKSETPVMSASRLAAARLGSTDPAQFSEYNREMMKMSNEYWGDDKLDIAYRQRHGPEEFNVETFETAVNDTQWLAKNGFVNDGAARINEDLEATGRALLAASGTPWQPTPMPSPTYDFLPSTPALTPSGAVPRIPGPRSATGDFISSSRPSHVAAASSGSGSRRSRTNSQPGGTHFGQFEPSAEDDRLRNQQETEIRALREATRSDKEDRIRNTGPGLRAVAPLIQQQMGQAQIQYFVDGKYPAVGVEKAKTMAEGMKRAKEANLSTAAQLESLQNSYFDESNRGLKPRRQRTATFHSKTRQELQGPSDIYEGARYHGAYGGDTRPGRLIDWAEKSAPQ